RAGPPRSGSSEARRPVTRWFISNASSVAREAAHPEVVVPEDPRRDGSVRPPAFRYLAELRERGSLQQTRDFHRSGRERLIPVRPDIGPQQAHRQIDVRGPSPDPAEPDEPRADGIVGQARENFQIETVQERDGEVAGVARLLPAEPDRAQLHVVERQQPRGGRIPDRDDEPIERGLRGGERHLLLQDEMDERGVAGVARPERWRTE